MPIAQFLKEGGVFEPDDIKGMSMAFEDVCKALDIKDAMDREVMAIRIIELAKGGERSPTRLRDGVLHAATMTKSFYTEGSSKQSA